MRCSTSRMNRIARRGLRARSAPVRRRYTYTQDSQVISCRDTSGRPAAGSRPSCRVRKLVNSH